MHDRFTDPGLQLEDLADEFLVECPRCRARAVVTTEPGGLPAMARCTCLTCGRAQRAPAGEAGSPGRPLAQQVPSDWHFGLPLWLRTPCAGEELWAWNERHLDFLAAYVGAKHRQRGPVSTAGPRNRTLASRLPVWMTRASQRETVLAAIDRLRARAASR